MFQFREAPDFDTVITIHVGLKCEKKDVNDNIWRFDYRNHPHVMLPTSKYIARDTQNTYDL